MVGNPNASSEIDWEPYNAMWNDCKFNKFDYNRIKIEFQVRAKNLGLRPDEIKVWDLNVCPLCSKKHDFGCDICSKPIAMGHFIEWVKPYIRGNTEESETTFALPDFCHIGCFIQTKKCSKKLKKKLLDKYSEIIFADSIASTGVK